MKLKDLKPSFEKMGDLESWKLDDEKLLADAERIDALPDTRDNLVKKAMLEDARRRQSERSQEMLPEKGKVKMR